MSKHDGDSLREKARSKAREGFYKMCRAIPQPARTQLAARAVLPDLLTPLKNNMTFESLRDNIIGIDSTFDTPFGKRHLIYADYTASGRCLTIVEHYLQIICQAYANTHTEDSFTGKTMTHLLESAEQSIKRCNNAGPDHRLVCVGSGSTAAIERLQMILGVHLAPATRALLKAKGIDLRALEPELPVVFLSPYEHHSNELSWREACCQVVKVPSLDASGAMDLAALQRLVRSPEYEGRQLIGAFSACSNVTGLLTDVPAVARIMHRAGGLAVFDYSASAPYVRIDVSGAGDPEARLDAVYYSPHKFIGGPGGCGVLLFHDGLYRRDLPPSLPGGGTVSFVTQQSADFEEDVEVREKAGTPSLMAVVRASLADQIKAHLTPEAIHDREQAMLRALLQRWGAHNNIRVYGSLDPAARVPIVSFNVFQRDDPQRVLHHKFVTTALSDLFGVQGRAGCSCAGPYGQLLQGFSDERLEEYRVAVRNGHDLLKPGFSRVGLHYVMDDVDVDCVISAVEFLAEWGHVLLRGYTVDATGHWVLDRLDLVTTAKHVHKWHHQHFAPAADLEALFETYQQDPVVSGSLRPASRAKAFKDMLQTARQLVAQLDNDSVELDGRFPDEVEHLRWFNFRLSRDDVGEPGQPSEREPRHSPLRLLTRPGSPFSLSSPSRLRSCGSSSSPSRPQSCGSSSSPSRPQSCGSPSSPSRPQSCGSPSSPSRPSSSPVHSNSNSKWRRPSSGWSSPPRGRHFP